MSHAFSVIFPVFGVILLGYGFARRGLIGEGAVDGLTDFVYLVAIPALLFRAMAGGALHRDLDPGILIAFFVPCVALFLLARLLSGLLWRLSATETALFGLTSTFNNIGLIGLAMIERAYGPPGLLPVLLILSVHSLILLGLTVVLIETARPGDRSRLATARSVGRTVLRNPIIFSLLAGLGWGATGIPLPEAVDTFFGLLARSAGPAALFAVGASLARFRLGGDLRQVVLAVFLKTLVLPALVWLLASQALRLDPLWTAVATLAAAMPTGINPYVFARRYKALENRASAAVLLSTLFSVLTLSILLTLFGASPGGG